MIQRQRPQVIWTDVQRGMGNSDPRWRERCTQTQRAENGPAPVSLSLSPLWAQEVRVPESAIPTFMLLALVFYPFSELLLLLLLD